MDTHGSHVHGRAQRRRLLAPLIRKVQLDQRAVFIILRVERKVQAGLEAAAGPWEIILCAQGGAAQLVERGVKVCPGLGFDHDDDLVEAASRRGPGVVEGVGVGGEPLHPAGLQDCFFL